MRLITRVYGMNSLVTISQQYCMTHKQFLLLLHIFIAVYDRHVIQY